MGNQASASLAPIVARTFSIRRQRSYRRQPKDYLARESSFSNVCTAGSSFEVCLIMQRLLHSWQSLQDAELAGLRSSLEDNAILILVFHDPARLWALAGLELQDELETTAARVAALGLKSGNPRLETLADLFSRINEPGADFSSFNVSEEEAEVILRFMQDQIIIILQLQSRMQELNPKLTRLLTASSISSHVGDYDEYSLKQVRQVEGLQQQSVWTQKLDLVVKVLVIVVFMVRKRLMERFGQQGKLTPGLLPADTLGGEGLAELYASIILRLEQMSKDSFAAMGAGRTELYVMLPTHIRAELDRRLRLSRERNKPSQTPRRGQASSSQDGGQSEGMIKVHMQGTREDSEANGLSVSEREQKELLKEQGKDKAKWAMTVLPGLARNTGIWQRNHTIGSSRGSSNAPSANVYRVQTLLHAHKGAVDSALLDWLEALCHIHVQKCEQERVQKRGHSMQEELESVKGSSDNSSSKTINRFFSSGDDDEDGDDDDDAATEEFVWGPAAKPLI
eukprot:TRINITY_DN13519_c0_g1_i1.p1 TRINITY_DN13519_c0_g1~~TRINITY_DN13519_c0_g1_i1.p1  ORF type:complete len:509 (+),score=90.98 TRINITY_DN13519_c0_g1_i1:362-1888(+)